MGCAAVIFGIVAGIWSLKEFSNEGPTTKAIALAVFSVVMFLLTALAMKLEGDDA